MPTGTIEAAFPLTPLQEGMLYHTLREPSAGVYHAQCIATLDGEIAEDRFREAWQLATRRHAALRTFFSWEGRERPLQAVRSEVEPDITFLDWRDAAADAQRERWRALLQKDRRRGFGLTRAPLMRCVVAHTGARRHKLLWAFHHALADGWSVLVVLDEVMRDYAALSTGGVPSPSAAPTFDRFVGWLQQQDAAVDEAFWRATFSGVSEPTVIPGRRAHGGDARASGERLTSSYALSVEATSRLRAAAARMRVTPNTMIMGAWAVLLGRRAGADDVAFGVTVSERPVEIEDVDRAVGLYLSSVPVRHRVGNAEHVGPWLRDLQIALSEARAHGAPGLPAIHRWSGMPAGRPLFESLVVFENFPADRMRPFVTPDGQPAPAHASLTVTAAELDVPNDVPLVLLALPGERLTLKLIRDPAEVSAAAADRLIGALPGLLEQLADDAEGLRIAELPALGAEERTCLVRQWAESLTPAPAPRDVLEAFEARVAERNAVVAVRTEHAEISYGSLDRHANRLAHRLLARRIGSGDQVGILAERSPEAIAAMLGVLKTGAAYVPLDPQAPSARLERLSAGLDAVLAPPSLASRVSPSVLALLDDAATESAERPDLAVDPPSAAYVIFTSGSTGEPKGVVVERRHLAASTAARLVYYPDEPRSFLLLSSPSVDSSVAGIYWTLCTGGTLVLPPPHGEQDVDALARLIERAGVTHMLLVPSLYLTLLEHVDARRFVSLRCVIVAGEACPPQVVRLHGERLPGVDLHNEYGPTETTVWATADELKRDSAAPVTIGRPVPGARVYILDEQLRLVPAGAPGEICIGGAFVARGYLNAPEDTARRFVTDPFVPGERIYRSGDRGRFLDDGRIEFLGRVDEQVKVRGYRVEPGDIERALLDCPGVRDAAVILASPMMPPDVDSLTWALLERSDAEMERLLAAVEPRS
jgi:amino acid adenylation domain-containing protein